MGAVLCAAERFPLDGSGIPQVGQPNVSSNFAQSPLGQAPPPSLRTSELQHFCSSGPMGPRLIGPRSSFPFHLPAAPRFSLSLPCRLAAREEWLQAGPALCGEEMLTTPALAFLHHLSQEPRLLCWGFKVRGEVSGGQRVGDTRRKVPREGR